MEDNYKRTQADWDAMVDNDLVERMTDDWTAIEFAAYCFDD